MLVAARRRGVDVEIIVPGPVLDAQVVRRASRAMWGPLLEAGVRIYEYQPTMFHVKVMVVDGVWVSAGSTNFDARSFRLNDEANLNVVDSAFAREQERVFDAVGADTGALGRAAALAALGLSVSAHLGQSQPNVPAVTRPYTSPSNTSFQATDQGLPIQIAAGTWPAAYARNPMAPTIRNTPR